MTLYGGFSRVDLDVSPSFRRVGIYFTTGEMTIDGTTFDQIQAMIRFNGTCGVAGRVKGTSEYITFK